MRVPLVAEREGAFVPSPVIEDKDMGGEREAAEDQHT